MIDDTPLARLMAVIFFGGVMALCAPFAYYLADVERYPVDHAHIQSLQPLHSTYFVTVTVHSQACEADHPADFQTWNNPETHATLLSTFHSTVPILPPPTTLSSTSSISTPLSPLHVINALDLEQPTRAHEMNVVVVATPTLPGGKEAPVLHVGPTRRSILLVSCQSHATITTDFSAAAATVHQLLRTDRTKHTDVVTVPTYRISMTLLDSAPNNRTAMTWSGAAMKSALQPFFNRLHSVMEIEVDTQIVRYATLSEKVWKSCGPDCAGGPDVRQNSSHFVTPKDLQRIRSMLSEGFTLESSAVSPLSTPLHLILYVPSIDNTPLYVVPSKQLGRTIDTTPIDATAERNRLGFYVPRYGGVAVWNVQHIAQDCSSGGGGGGGSGSGSSGRGTLFVCAPSDAVLDTTSDLWVSQLRQVLGVTSISSHQSPTVFFIRAPSGISDWELDSLARGRLSHFAALTIKSLTALSTLVQDMSHMAVPASAGKHVVASLEQYETAVALLAVSEGGGDGGGEGGGEGGREGGGEGGGGGVNTVDGALEKISRAFEYARLAEMNPTMAPLRYFPPAHLAAVYLPLIIPLILPILVGLKSGFREYRSSTKKKD